VNSTGSQFNGASSISSPLLPTRWCTLVFHLSSSIASRELSVIMGGQRLKHEQFPMYLILTLGRTLSYKEHLTNWCQAKKQELPLGQAGWYNKGCIHPLYISPSFVTQLWSIVFLSGQAPPTPSWSTVNWIIPCDWYQVHYSPLNFLGCVYLLTLLHQSYDRRQSMMLFWPRYGCIQNGQSTMIIIFDHPSQHLISWHPVWTDTVYPT